MRKGILVGGLAALLLLVGAGCVVPGDESGTATTTDETAVTSSTEEAVDATAVTTSTDEAVMVEKKSGKDDKAMKEKKKMMEKKAEGEAMEKKDVMMVDGSVKLTAEALGNGQVKLSWTTDEKIGADRSFIIVRGTIANPDNSGKNHWFRQYYTKRETTWLDNPKGAMHYRVCVTAKNMKDKCEAYSEDVTVEVK